MILEETGAGEDCTIVLFHSHSVQEDSIKQAPVQRQQR